MKLIPLAIALISGLVCIYSGFQVYWRYLAIINGERKSFTIYACLLGASFFFSICMGMAFLDETSVLSFRGVLENFFFSGLFGMLIGILASFHVWRTLKLRDQLIDNLKRKEK